MKIPEFLRCAAIVCGSVTILCLLALAHQPGDVPRIVTWNCSGCHGLSGNSESPYFPRLSGLNTAYAERRIKEFQSVASPPADEIRYRAMGAAPIAGANRFEARVHMIGIAHALTAQEAKDSAAWYGTQKPGLGRDGNSEMIEAGRLLYVKGAPSPGVPACQSCHGAGAEGQGNTPRLAGQNSNYLAGELGKFNAGDRKHAPEMTMVARNLDASQIRALAAYLQSR